MQLAEWQWTWRKRFRRCIKESISRVMTSSTRRQKSTGPSCCQRTYFSYNQLRQLFMMLQQIDDHFFSFHLCFVPCPYRSCFEGERCKSSYGWESFPTSNRTMAWSTSSGDWCEIEAMMNDVIERLFCPIVRNMVVTAPVMFIFIQHLTLFMAGSTRPWKRTKSLWILVRAFVPTWHSSLTWSTCLVQLWSAFFAEDVRGPAKLKDLSCRLRVWVFICSQHAKEIWRALVFPGLSITNLKNYRMLMPNPLLAMEWCCQWLAAWFFA